jgi:hypothetical protein
MTSINKKYSSWKAKLLSEHASLHDASCAILSKYSGDQFHINKIKELMPTLNDKHSKKYGFETLIFDNTTPKKEISNFLLHRENCALLHFGDPHYTPIIKYADKICVFAKEKKGFDNFFNESNKKIYTLDPEIFRKPQNEPAQDDEVIDYQSDDASCGIIGQKIAKNMLKNNSEAFEGVMFDEENNFFYPRPDIFKQSQSNIFLQYYKQRYVDKQREVDLEFDPTPIETEINNYRNNHFGKARIFYYNLKHLQHIQETYTKNI